MLKYILMGLTVLILSACNNSKDEDCLHLITLEEINGGWEDREFFTTAQSSSITTVNIYFSSRAANSYYYNTPSNIWGFSDNEINMRNLVVKDANTITGEGKVRYSNSNAPTWNSIEITKVNDNELEVVSTCSSCVNGTTTTLYRL